MSSVSRRPPPPDEESEESMDSVDAFSSANVFRRLAIFATVKNRQSRRVSLNAFDQFAPSSPLKKLIEPPDNRTIDTDTDVQLEQA